MITHILASSKELFHKLTLEPFSMMTTSINRFLNLLLIATIGFHFVLRADADMIQDEPIRVNDSVRVMGTTFVSARDGKDADVEAPALAEPGDVLVMFLAGSASGKKIPSSPGRDWTLIIGEGREDLNLRAYWKVADADDLLVPLVLSDVFAVEHNIFAAADEDSVFADETWSIEGGKNTFVAVVALRGVHHTRPVVDAEADEDTKSGREGEARAPSVRTARRGIVLSCFAYDDPHVSTITTRGFEMLLSTDTRSGDGLALAVAPTDGDRTGSIDAIGSSFEKGGSDDIAMTISFRAGDPPTYPPTALRKSTPRPTPSPTVEEFDTRTLFAVRLAPLVDARLDPIANPGTCGTHVHSVFGAASFGKTIDNADLQNVDTSANVLPNKSLYWAPSLYIFDPNSDKFYIAPTYARAYYRFSSEFLHETKSFPLNFRIVVGDAARKTKYRRDEPRDEVHWTRKGNRRFTNSRDHSSWDEYVEEFGYLTDPEEYMEMNIDFPECIAVDDLENPLLDSPDHRSHMKYINRNDPCPPDYPYRVPRINLEVRYELDKMVDDLGEDVVQNPANWYLSTGDHTGAGAHADFLSGWNEGILDMAIKECRGGNAESGCVLTQFFQNSRSEDRAKRVSLTKEMPAEVISPIDELILVPDGSCPSVSGPTKSPSDSPPQSSPSSDPSSSPSSLPSLDPSSEPSAMPSSVPSSLPSLEPSGSPSESPQSSPSSDPSSSPSSLPSLDASSESAFPSKRPSKVPTASPSFSTTAPSHTTDIPTTSPSRPPAITRTRTCNTTEERKCRYKCFAILECGDNPSSSCHSVCRHICCDKSDDAAERTCNTNQEKSCRTRCFYNQNCGEDELCKKICRARCCV